MLETESSMDNTEMGQAALEKAKELFSVCDSEDKGFIIKRDMQRLKDDMPGLSPDQLEEVFDSLDQDHNGYLTMDQFVRGFGTFIGLQIPIDFASDSGGPEAEIGSLADELHGAQENETVEQEYFDQLMDRIGAKDVIHDQDTVKEMWSKLRNDDPEVLNHFEGFLTQVSSELRRKKDDVAQMETAIDQRTQSHEQQIKKLYEEMETQIKEEKERVAKEEREKAERQREELEREISERDTQMQEIQNRHAELEKKLSNLDNKKAETQHENEALQKEREAFMKEKAKMERELEGTRRSYEEYKEQLEIMRQKTLQEKRERAKQTFRVSQNIASEREGLVNALDTLRERNKQLQDERDEISATQRVDRDAAQSLSLADELGVFSQSGLVAHPTSDDGQRIDPSMMIVEDDGDGDVMPLSNELLLLDGQRSASSNKIATVLPQRNANPNQQPLANELQPAAAQHVTRQSGQQQAFGMTDEETDTPADFATPDRIFKVVFVGDSGVGKTCFLHRFCHNRFKSTFSATIGVDFTVKSLRVGDRVIALQLWDTAGQERFRSITKQYFRKADGVVMMYDVTSEMSFLSLRNWMSSVKDGVEENCVICMVGNKVDVCEDEETRGVRFEDGQKLAEEFQCLFFETSAQSGDGIMETMKAMAVHLQEREDLHLENALKLEMTVEKRRKCCSS